MAETRNWLFMGLRAEFRIRPWGIVDFPVVLLFVDPIRHVHESGVGCGKNLRCYDTIGVFLDRIKIWNDINIEKTSSLINPNNHLDKMKNSPIYCRYNCLSTYRLNFMHWQIKFMASNGTLLIFISSLFIHHR